MKKVKIILTVSCCFLVTAILYVYLCLIFSPKSIHDSGGTTYYRGMGFLAEPRNSIDVMLYGNSDIYSGFAPAKLFKKYGYTSYTSGTALQTIGDINCLLKKTLKTQAPKVAILEVDCLYEKRNKAINDSNFLFAPFVFHVRWKELRLSDFYTIPDRTKKYDITKGFVHSNQINKYQAVNYMGNENANPLPIPKRNLRQLKNFIETCRMNNIEIVFLELPSASSWNYAKHNFIKDLSKGFNIPFIDLNVKKINFDIDFSRDFRDKGDHMNVFGAEKATTYIGEYLNDKYSSILSDKRSYKEYAYWQDVVDHYRRSNN
ncbi:hypothetical protein [Oceanirhabdus seepicola]|uniref:SGNH/GDSL hydrolase family protein n=1 Tax=Oceanirhabdus seepicola TaxID=2828781 RepID=A0A9J6NW78_9CLOT|nr:hypothetical protein [Oceanirhabdus seepicola]MCM1988751.1 hypothetical protein [Oceanirhabdus seepicola]